jgi:hypothetical protein
MSAEVPSHSSTEPRRFPARYEHAARGAAIGRLDDWARFRVKALVEARHVTAFQQIIQRICRAALNSSTGYLQQVVDVDIIAACSREPLC